MLERMANGTLGNGCTLSRIVIDEGETPLAGSIVYFQEHDKYTRVVAAGDKWFDIESPFLRLPMKGEHFDYNCQGAV
jgi:hypothetical protein